MRMFLFLVSFAFSSIACAEIGFREEIYNGQTVRVVHPRDLPSVIGEHRMPTIINGRKTLPGEFPGVFQIVGTENGDGFSCSGQLHGSKLLSTAAHCIGDTNHLKANGKLIALDCEVEPNKVDGALCELAEPLIVSKYVNWPIGKVKMADCPDSVGFGVTLNNGDCGECGTQHIGENMCIFSTSGQEYRTRNGNKTVLGFGDSGGASLHNLSDTFGEPHTLNGIHSAVLVDGDNNILDVSIMVDVTETRMQAFIRKFVSDRGLEACGLNIDCGADTAPLCVEEQGALDQARHDFDHKEAEYQLCRQNNGSWKCIKEGIAVLKANLKVKAAERALKKCQKGKFAVDEMDGIEFVNPE